MHRFAFVLEQTLGHVAHGRNLERALATETNIDPVIIRVGYSEPDGVQRLPGLRTWSYRASAMARNGLREAMRHGRLDAIFIHTQVAALLATDIMRRVPTIISLDATPRQFDREGEAYGHRRGPEVVELVKRRANIRAFAEATRLVTWCQWAAYSLISEYGVPPQKVDVIPPGVELDLFQPSLVPKASPLWKILFVGGEFERKGGPDLLEAVRLLGDGVQLDIVTASRVEVPAGLNVRVHHNLKPQSDGLVALYRGADMFALPSRGDCMPQAVAEALACGKPVVATRAGAIPEMVRDGVNGFLVPARDPQAIAAAIRSLMDTSGRRLSMGRWSRVLAQQEFDARRNNRRIFGLMRAIASQAGEAVKTA